MPRNITTKDALRMMQKVQKASVESADSHYTHTQGTASDTWVVKHNLGKNPAVTVVDSAGTEVVGDVTHNDKNTVTITFKAQFKGKAYLN